MALSWSDRRQYTYIAVGAIILLLVAWGIWSVYFSAPATCQDGKQNGTELGVDCGGVCALICPQQSRQPTVLWARAFLTSPSTYTAAAYIQNQNLGAGAHSVAYSFQLFDENNALVVERDGIADLPPVATIPIVESNIPTGSRNVVRALFAFSSVPPWSTVRAGSIPQIHVSNQMLSEDGARLSLDIENDTVQDANNITVVGVLFDTNGVALAASKSLIASLPHKSSHTVTFTWPQGTPHVVRAEITVLPSF